MTANLPIGMLGLQRWRIGSETIKLKPVRGRLSRRFENKLKPLKEKA
jgi:hypothetical protein